MAVRRPRSPSAPGSGRGRSGRRPAGNTPKTRSTSRAASADTPTPGVAQRSKFTSRALILLLVLAVLAVSYASSARAWLNQRSHNNELRAEIAGLEADVDALRTDKRRWNDAEFIKAEARSRFGWVLPGEVGYRVIDEDGEVIVGDASALSDPTTPDSGEDPQWWDEAWGSVVAAGADPDARPAPDPQPAPAERLGDDRGKGADGKPRQR